MDILYPAAALFALTAVTVFRLAYLRFGAIRNGAIDPRFFRLYQGYEQPEPLRIADRHLRNLFEAPVLFYVVLIIAFVTGQSGWLPVALAWGYVLLRVAHSYVHLTSNKVPLRFRLFALSWVVLILLWLAVFLGMALA